MLTPPPPPTPARIAALTATNPGCRVSAGRYFAVVEVPGDVYASEIEAWEAGVGLLARLIARIVLDDNHNGDRQAEPSRTFSTLRRHEPASSIANDEVEEA